MEKRTVEIVLVDACILIEILRGKSNLLKNISDRDFAINSIVYMELIQGAKDKQEIAKLEKFLKNFELIQIDENISEKSMKLIKNYSKSHGLIIADAIIAATCLEKDIELLTLNMKDFKFILGLKIYSP